MLANAQEVSCRYHYDALDRLIGTAPTHDAGLRRFYCKTRLATEIQGAMQRSVFLQGEHLLAEQRRWRDVVECSVLATDQMRSVLQAVKANCTSPIAYSPYGHSPVVGGLLSLLGFNGEQPDPFTRHYILGNGYRAYNPVLMRFNSPDNMSPFGRGGINPYAYSLGDPTNRFDESGHISWPKWLKSAFRKKPKTYKNLEPESRESEFLNFHNQQAKIKEPLIKQVSSAGDMAFLKGENHAKFIITKDKRLIVGRQINPYEYGLLEPDVLFATPGRYREVSDAHNIVTHGVLADYANSSKVIFSGQMYLDYGMINNNSGHFQLPDKSLKIAKRYLEKNKIMEVRKTVGFKKMYDTK